MNRAVSSISDDVLNELLHFNHFISMNGVIFALKEFKLFVVIVIHMNCAVEARVVFVRMMSRFN